MFNRARLFGLITVVVTTTTAFAQDDFLAHWQSLQKAQPAEVKFNVSTSKSSWYLGETIPLQLAFTSTASGFSADTRLYDRIGRMNGVERFVVDPADGAEDPLLGQSASAGGMGGISGGPMTLSEKPFSFERILNEWVRFRGPGTYRVYVLSHRVGRGMSPARPSGLDLVSNVLTLEVLPAPVDWVKQQISSAVAVLDAPDVPNDQAVRTARQNAGHVLQHLDTLESALELLKHLDGGNDVDSFGMYAAVLGSHHRAQLLPLMEQRLIAPVQPVWSRYLDALAELSCLVVHGPMREYPKDVKAQPAWQDESKKRAEVCANKRQEYASRLVAAIPTKEPAARGVSLTTLWDETSRVRTLPSWRQAVIDGLIANFASMTPQVQRELLEYRWAAVRSPAILPMLRAVYANPPARYDPPMDDAALRRIYELAPQEGRKLILDEIRHPTKNLRFSTLAMLPDRTLPELDTFFIAELNAGRANDLLVLRYASGSIVAGAEKAYQGRHLTNCATPLVYYFLRYDPKFGETELRRSLSLASSYPACYDMGFQFQQLGEYAMSPALERLAIEYLKDPAVPIKKGAAEVLGKYGSSAALEPLWQAMEYFHAWWKDRDLLKAEPSGGPNQQLDRSLRMALALGSNWVLDAQGLDRLAGLCSGEWCRSEVMSWRSTAKSPVEISVQQTGEGFAFNIAQYYQVSAIQLQHKLKQYPAGTLFHVWVSGMEDVVPGMKEQRQIVEEAVRANGQKLAG